MAWQDTHSICDYPIAFHATQSAQMADTDLALGTSDLTTVAVAKAACVTNANNGYVGERFMGINCSAGMQAASDMGGTFASTFAVLFASLPTNSTNSKALMING